jgi:hypothetical protein
MRHKLDTATVNEDNRAVLEGYSFCRPYLSEAGGNEGLHEWVVRLEGHSLVVIGVAEAGCDRGKDMHQQVRNTDCRKIDWAQILFRRVKRGV